MSGSEDRKDDNLDVMEDSRIEDAGGQKKGELLDNIRQPHSEIYAEALLRYPTDECIDKTAEEKLRRKLDYRILPLLGICYFFYVRSPASYPQASSLNSLTSIIIVRR